MAEEKQVVFWVDEDLWAQAKSQAALEKKTIKDWLETLIREKLEVSAK